jgi:hypothetical protein
VIEKTDLGEFGFQPFDQEVLERVKALNSDLDLEQIEVIKNNNGQVLIRVIEDS